MCRLAHPLTLHTHRHTPRLGLWPGAAPPSTGRPCPLLLPTLMIPAQVLRLGTDRVKNFVGSLFPGKGLCSLRCVCWVSMGVLKGLPLPMAL